MSDMPNIPAKERRVILIVGVSSYWGSQLARKLLAEAEAAAQGAALE